MPSASSLTRVDLYADQPSDEQIAQARCELRDTVERLERARRTREARCRPEVVDLLDLHLARLGLLDPQRSARVAIAGHSLHAILARISIFDAKLTAKTLPDGVAQSGDWRLWPAAARARMLFFWYAVVTPVTRVLGYLPGGAEARAFLAGSSDAATSLAS